MKNLTKKIIWNKERNVCCPSARAWKFVTEKKDIISLNPLKNKIIIKIRTEKKFKVFEEKSIKINH